MIDSIISTSSVHRSTEKDPVHNESQRVLINDYFPILSKLLQTLSFLD